MIEREMDSRLTTTVPSVDGRVYALYAPQLQTRPFIVTHKVSSTRTYSHDGDSMLTRDMFQISCYDNTFLETTQVRDEVLASMETWDLRTFLINERHIYEFEVGLFRIDMDYHIWHKL